DAHAPERPIVTQIPPDFDQGRGCRTGGLGPRSGLLGIRGRTRDRRREQRNPGPQSELFPHRGVVLASGRAGTAHELISTAYDVAPGAENFEGPNATRLDASLLRR